MTDNHLIVFGPPPAYRVPRLGDASRALRPGAYLTLGGGGSGKIYGGDRLIGTEHDSLASFEAEVEQIRADLDEALRQAREYFQPSQKTGSN